MFPGRPVKDLLLFFGELQLKWRLRSGIGHVRLLNDGHK
jgi:hypothetical protein